jgi:predicted metal-dependent phosphoesterase TrpH
MPLRFDLQSHSNHSDGSLAASEVVERATDAGVELLALTDHDTVSGVSEALAAGRSFGVRVVPAIEISSVDDGGPVARELHILGYGIDHTSPALVDRLAEFVADREQRTLRMAAALREVGLELDESEITARRAQKRPIGRPHLAEAVFACAANERRLKTEQIEEIGSFISAYLVPGRPAFRTRAIPTVAQAVETVHDAGGLAVWAHPFWDISPPEDVMSSIDRFLALGLDGVEAFYVTHTQTQTELLAARCKALGLLSTGSADFHGPENRLFSRFLAFDTYGLEPNLGPIASALQQ